jgi:hypothetical protein
MFQEDMKCGNDVLSVASRDATIASTSPDAVKEIDP